MKVVSGNVVGFFQALPLKAEKGKENVEKSRVDIKEKIREQFDSQQDYIEVISDLITFFTSCSVKNHKRVSSIEYDELAELFNQLKAKAKLTNVALQLLNEAFNTDVSIDIAELSRRLDVFAAAYGAQSSAALALKPHEDEIKTICGDRSFVSLWNKQQAAKPDLVAKDGAMQQGKEADPYKAFLTIVVNRPTRMSTFQADILKQLDKLTELPGLALLKGKYKLLSAQAEHVLAKNNERVTLEEQLGEPTPICEIRIDLDKTKTLPADPIKVDLWVKKTTRSKTNDRKIVMSGSLRETDFQHNYLQMFDKLKKLGFTRDHFTVKARQGSEGNSLEKSSIMSVKSFLDGIFRLLDDKDEKRKAHRFEKALLNPSKSEELPRLGYLISFERLIAKDAKRSEQANAFEAHVKCIENENAKLSALLSTDGREEDALRSELQELQAAFDAISIDDAYTTNFAMAMRATDATKGQAKVSSVLDYRAELSINVQADGEAGSLRNKLFQTQTLATLSPAESYINDGFIKSLSIADSFNAQLELLQNAIEENQTLRRRSDLIAEIESLKKAIKTKTTLAEIGQVKRRLEDKLREMDQQPEAGLTVKELANRYLLAAKQFFTDLTSQLTDLQEDKKEVDQQFADATKQSDMLRGQLAQAEASTAALNQQISQLNSQLTAAQTEVKALEGTNKELGQQLSAANTALDTAKTEIAKAQEAHRTEIAQLKADYQQQADQAKQAAEQQLKERDNQLTAAQVEIEALKGTNEELSQQLSTANTALDTAKTEIAETQKAHTVKVAELEASHQQQAEQAKQAAEQQLADATRERDKLSDQVARLAANKAVLEQQLTQANSTLATQRQTSDDAGVQLVSLKELLSTAKAEIITVRAEYAQLQAQLADKSQNDSGDATQVSSDGDSDDEVRQDTFQVGHATNARSSLVDSGSLSLPGGEDERAPLLVVADVAAAVNSLIDRMIDSDNNRIFTFFSGDSDQLLRRQSLLRELRLDITADNAPLRAKQVALLFALPRSNGLCTKAIGDNYSASQLITYLMAPNQDCLRRLLTDSIQHDSMQTWGAERWRQHIKSFIDNSEITKGLQAIADIGESVTSITDMSALMPPPAA